MRILFDEGVHNMRNKGNNAMLQAAITRLSQYWPDASLDVLTFAPYLTRLYFPNVNPTSPHNIQRIKSRFDRLIRLMPRPFLWLLLELRELTSSHEPIKLTQQLAQRIRSKFLNHNSPDKGTNKNESEKNDGFDETQYQMTIHDGLANYDLIVCTGGGVFYDFDSITALKVINRLEAAISLGIPTVMVGQGIGSMNKSQLISRAKEVLPKVNIICVRNRRIGLSTLLSLGVPSERVVFTGDDAVEMAYQVRPPSLGGAVGVSLRLAGYTQVDKDHISLIRPVIHEAAQKHQAQLVAIPISSHHDELDITYIKRLLAGYNHTSTGWRMLDTPLDTIRKVGQCRVMITGTYHGAIFALAQGIPAIALVYSAEYIEKLSELKDEYGLGCQVLRLDDEDLPKSLSAAIEVAWASAEELRPRLLGVASQQIALQHSAYRQIYDLVISKGESKIYEQQ
jgi:colanic acid/amylovoran biosynthesis protein